MSKFGLISVMLISLSCPMFADSIHLDLIMPDNMYYAGSLFSLDLDVTNSGSAFSDAELYIALTVGTGDFWFYPSWTIFPPDIDWENVFIAATSTNSWGIIPAFPWPSGAGSFDGAMFFAAILHSGHLVSNLADIHFGWSDHSPPPPPPTPTPTQTPAPTWTPTPTPTRTPTPPGGFVFIPHGNFMRGSPETEPCRSPYGPWDKTENLHEVQLTRSFYIMTTEITRQMWAALKAVQSTLPDDPSNTTISPTGNHPVQRVTWYEAILYANLMSLRDGLTRCYYKDSAFTVPVDATNYTTGPIYFSFYYANGYRLPTEAEWEHAARAGTTGPFPINEPNYNETNCHTCIPTPTLQELNRIAWWCGNSDTGSGLMAQPVGTKLANPWSLHDMHGNAAEWCWDWYAPYPNWTVANPRGPATGTEKLVRGGSWDSTARWCRSATRGSVPPETRYFSTGFRLARNAN
jgi:formylglycine-generating enzyme required for sulfatase activity